MSVSGRTRLSGLVSWAKGPAEWCLDYAAYYRVPVTVTSVFRSWEEQQALYTNYLQCVSSGRFGRPPDCLYPANPPGQSAHEYRMAWDSVVAPEHQQFWDEVRRYAGFQVPENDRIHAQVPGWREYT